MHRARRLAGEALQLLQHTDGVLIDGVGVEQIELHLSDDMSPQRRVGPEHAVAVHRQQRALDRARMAQNRHKKLARFRNLTQRLFEMTTRVAQLAQRGGVDAANVFIAHHHVEHAQDRLRFALEQRFVAQVDQVAAQLKSVVQRARLFRGGERQDRFVKQL